MTTFTGNAEGGYPGKSPGNGTNASSSAHNLEGTVEIAIWSDKAAHWPFCRTMGNDGT